MEIKPNSFTFDSSIKQKEMYAEIIELTQTTVTFKNENGRTSTIERSLVCEKYSELEVGYMEIEPKNNDAENEIVEEAFYGGYVAKKESKLASLMASAHEGEVYNHLSKYWEKQ